MSKRLELTLERLKEYLEYNPDTGIFTWIKSLNHRAGAGRKAICLCNKGPLASQKIIVIRIDGRLYRAHRLAWFYMTGRWPTLIDHKNGISTDNRWNNLREATYRQNQANRKISKTNKTGFKGVQTHPESSKFMARIRANGKNLHLGVFDTAEEAHRAYLDAARRYHGEFARGR